MNVGVKRTTRTVSVLKAVGLSVFLSGLAVLFATAAQEQATAAAGGSDDVRLWAEGFAAEYTRKRHIAPNTEIATPRQKPARYRIQLADALTADREPARRDAMSIAALAPLDVTLFDEAAKLAYERRCLAQALYYEARSESVMGQLAVADVIMNRVKSGIYPDTICDVVFEGSERRTGCQFSFACDGSMRVAVRPKTWERADELAGFVMAGLREPVTRSATHYHASYVDPHWADTLVPTAYIGTHIFYRFPRKKSGGMGAAPASL